jgi:hypothetical protein
MTVPVTTSHENGVSGSKVAMDCVRNRSFVSVGVDKPAEESDREAERHNELSPHRRW